MGDIHRMSEAPGTERLSEEEKDRVMHIALPIGGDLLMASDIIPSMGHKLVQGNNNYVSLFPESREEATHLFNGLSAGGTVEMPLADAFWGAYCGSFIDKIGIHWMVNFEEEIKWVLYSFIRTGHPAVR